MILLPPSPGELPGQQPRAAVLFDRDGTLIENVPYNADPALVRPVAGAREALDRCRDAGLAVGVVTNQSGVGRGMFTLDAVAVMAAAVEERLGRFDVWCVCPHDPEDGCGCRKPLPGLVYEAVEVLRADVMRTAVIGDSPSDAQAARAAGVKAIGVGSVGGRIGDVPWFGGIGEACDAAIAYTTRSGLPSAR